MASHASLEPWLTGGIGGNGEARLAYFKHVVTAPNLSLTGAALDFNGLSDGSAWLALITFLYVDFMDCTGEFNSAAPWVSRHLAVLRQLSSETVDLKWLKDDAEGCHRLHCWQMMPCGMCASAFADVWLASRSHMISA